MALDTRIHLVAELEKIQPRTPQIELIISEAKAGEYHDYKNKKYTCGKFEAVSKLSAAGLGDLAKRVRSGEFDEQADEEDRDAMREGMPPEMWPTLGLEKRP